MSHAQECIGEGADWLQLVPLDLQTPIEPRPQRCAIPLTALQRYVFKFLILEDPAQRPLSVRTCASATRITGPLSPCLLERSIAGLVHRHESLRITFKTSDGITTQHIDPPGEYTLTCVDLSALPRIEAEGEVRQLAREFQDQRIDLSIGPLFEARLFKLATEEHVLIVLADHMISDGMSNAILDKQIWQAFDDALGDTPASLPVPPIQFADYAVWEERTKESWRKQHEHYWRQHLAEAAPVIIPASAQTNKFSDTGTVAHIAFGSDLTAQLRRFAEREQVPLSSVMLVIYTIVMSFWCDREDLIIRYPVHGRHCNPELRDVIGLLCNCLYLRIYVHRRCTLKGLLALVRNEIRNALTHRDFARALDITPEVAKTELEFHWRPARWRKQAERRPPNPNQLIKRQPFLIRSPAWHWNFWCIFNETPSDICVTVLYRQDLLRPDAVEQFRSEMQSVAKTLIDQPLDPVDRAISSRGTLHHDALS